MTAFKLLDADFTINFIRTLSLVDEEHRERILDSIESDQHYQFITTKEVKNEIKQKIFNKKSNKEVDEFFSKRTDIIRQIERRLFKNIRVLTVDKNCELTVLISSTSLRNLGEKSLVVLLLCKYYTHINSHQNSVHIVSNNHKDIQPIYRKAVRVSPKSMHLSDDITTIQTIHEFYIELFQLLHINKEVILYFLFVSNIDSRVFSSEIIDTLKEIL